MISLMSFEHPHVPPNADEDGLSSFILSIADFAGMQEDGNGGSFQLWNLRKALSGHPKGSTVSRRTLEAAYKAGYSAIQGKYGATGLYGLDGPKKAQDFDAIEQPE